MPFVDVRAWKQRLPNPRDVKDFVLFFGSCLLIPKLHRAAFLKRVGDFLNLPFDPQKFEDRSPLWEVRQEFVEGLVAGGMLLILLAAASVLSERTSRRALGFIASITCLPAIVNAVLIFATCDHLRDDTGVAAVFPFDTRTKILTGTLILVGVGYYLLDRRKCRALPAAESDKHG